MTVRVRKRQPPPSHWIGVRKYWRLLGLPLRQALVELNASHLSQHAMILGSTGSGKSVALLHTLAGDLMRGHSIVILDASGDMAFAGFELAARSGISPDKVKLFDLRERKRPLGFNPLGGSAGVEPHIRALHLVDAVAARFGELGPQSSEYLRYAALVTAESGGSLTHFEGLFYDRAVRSELISRATSESVRAFWRRYDALSIDRQTALAPPVMNKVSGLLATEGLRRTLGHPEPLDLARHLATPGSVTLISLATAELHSAGWAIGNLLLSCICREIFSQVDVPESHRNGVRVYVDEFASFATQPFEVCLAQGRRFGLSVVLVAQNIAQLEPRIRAILLGNCGCKLVFRSSHADSLILNRDLTGTKDTFDIASLRTGEAVLWRRGESPFEIEINAPLIRDVGQLSPLALDFLAEVRAQQPSFPEPGPELSHLVTKAAHVKSGPRESPARGLEDWLQ
ncbi:MAG: type IV secretion system DNA-binding domain-containing protein [Fimbriimonadaceae bacterium]|nr:type IV secretion system DNA-binding domain-containing protein [Fimbriimonadaceae bacterium]